MDVKSDEEMHKIQGVQGVCSFQRHRLVLVPINVLRFHPDSFFYRNQNTC